MLVARLALLALVLLASPASATRLHLGQTARFAFIPGANAEWHRIEQREPNGAILTGLDIMMPVTSFTVTHTYGTTWSLRACPARMASGQQELGPCSEWSEPLEWIGTSADLNGDGHISPTDFRLFRRQYLGLACGTELVFAGACP